MSDRWTANPAWTLPTHCAGCGQLISRNRAGTLYTVRPVTGSPFACPGNGNGQHTVPE
jgi:hypothetical protein